jgi:hypothetical protein
MYYNNSNGGLTMKKKMVFFSLLLITGVCAFSIDFTVSYIGIITITDNKLHYSDSGNIDEEYDITWENINGVEYITFNYTGKFLDEYGRRPQPHGIKRYLILYGGEIDDRHGDFLFLYNDNNELVFNCWSRLALNNFTPEYNLISATSELVEGNITYSVRNLQDRNRLQPWAEGSRGSGIGEKIFIEFDPANRTGLSPRNISRWSIRGIAISNGFVDYNRPYLYQYNNRVKKIRVHFIDPDDYMDFDVLDTPQIQLFIFDRRSAKVQIEILEVYSGERWDDTCINNIFPYSGAPY